MIVIFFIIIFLLAIILANKHKSEGFIGIAIFTGFINLLFMVGVSLDVYDANIIKTKIILMKPLEKYREDIAINEKELAKVERLIDKAFDKNNPNISVKMENNVKIYSFLGSSDLGSAEAGNAEKQKLLMNYINKQNEIADRLIMVKKLAYGDEFYKLQQEYAVYENSFFDGLIVKWFSIKEDYKPVKNQIYVPSDN